MDGYSSQYQQQQQQQQQQQTMASQPYDPSQVQPYDQSTQAYYAYYNQYNQQYPYYQHQPTSIHPPGVPIQPDPTLVSGQEHGFGQTHVQNQQNFYYPDGIVGPQLTQEQWQGNNGGFGLGQMIGGPRVQKCLVTNLGLVEDFETR